MVKVYYLEADGDIPSKSSAIYVWTFGNKMESKTLEDLGKEGWNLSHIISLSNGKLRFIFKRFGD